MERSFDLAVPSLHPHLADGAGRVMDEVLAHGLPRLYYAVVRSSRADRGDRRTVALPSPARQLDSKHAVTPDEVEDAVFDARRLLRSGRNNILEIYSRTEGGRYLFIAAALRPHHHISIITARDMTDGERRLYTKKRRTP